MKKKSNPEPSALVRGKAFDRQLGDSWLSSYADAVVNHELARVEGRRRLRPDIRVALERHTDDTGAESLLLTLLEVKSRNFPALSAASTRRLIASDRRQILRYSDAILASGIDGVPRERIEIAPSMVYRLGPHGNGGREAIEAFFDELGVGVIWEDESAAQAAARLTIASIADA